MGKARHQVSRQVAILIGTRLAALLQENDMTAYELATTEGISYNTVTSWLRGDNAPQLGQLLHLVEVFGLCSIEELIGGPLGTRVARHQHRHT